MHVYLCASIYMYGYVCVKGKLRANAQPVSMRICVCMYACMHARVHVHV
jgi:hypothetical protein